jgi:hypothetical protein
MPKTRKLFKARSHPKYSKEVYHLGMDPHPNLTTYQHTETPHQKSPAIYEDNKDLTFHRRTYHSTMKYLHHILNRKLGVLKRFDISRRKCHHRHRTIMMLIVVVHFEKR